MLSALWMRLSSNSLARNTGWLLLGQGVGLILQAYTFFLLARLLGTLQYGIFAGAFAFTMLVVQYAALGTGTVFLRYVSSDHKLFSVYWGNLLLVTVFVGGLLIGMSRILGPRYLNPASASLVLFASISNCFGAQLTQEIAKVFQAFEQMSITAILNLQTSLLRALAVTALSLSLHRASAMQWAIASMLVSLFGSCLAIAVVTYKFGFPRFELGRISRHGMEGVGYSVALSTSSIYNDIDKTLLSHYNMNLDNGIYSMAYRIIDIATSPLYSLRDAALPRLFRAGHASLAEISGLTTKLLMTGALFGGAATVGLFVCAPFLPHIVGGGFSASVEALRWLALIPLFRSIHQFTGAAITGAGLQRYRTFSQASMAGINLALNVVLIPRYGWHGAAWTSLATDGGLAFLNWILLKWLIAKSVSVQVAV